MTIRKSLENRNFLGIWLGHPYNKCYITPVPLMTPFVGSNMTTLHEPMSASREYRVAAPILDNMAFRLALTYRQEADELRSEADVHFMRAYVEHDPAKGPFKNYMKFVVNHSLLELCRREARRGGLLPRADTDPNFMGTTPPQFNLEDFTDGLTGDAAEVVKLVFQTPEEIQQEVDARGGYTDQRFRTALRKYLRGLGWHASRIADTFQEVAGALSRE